MTVIDTLRRQHQEILDLAAEITAALKSSPPAVEQISALLPSLAGKLSIHLAMEDNALYPRLLDSKEEKVRQTAAAFIAQMGDLKKVFKDYTKRWNSSLKIKEQLAEFNRETQTIFAALAERIEREDQELYQENAI